MTFAQRRNLLTTYFSERIPVVKRRMTVYPQWRSAFISCFTSVCTVSSDRRTGCRYSYSCPYSVSCSTGGRICRSTGGLRPSTSRCYRPQCTVRRPAIQRISGTCSCCCIRRTGLRSTCIRCICACANPSQVKVYTTGPWRIRYNPALLLPTCFVCMINDQ